MIRTLLRPVVAVTASCCCLLAPAGAIASPADPQPVVSASSGPIGTPIPDAGEASHSVTLPDAGTVLDVDVAVEVAHGYAGDVELELVSPAGARVKLVSGSGGSNDFTYGGDCPGTVAFDDSAARTPASGETLSGTYTPLQPLSSLAGGPSGGAWQLVARDTDSGTSGALRCWSIRVSTGPLPAGAMSTDIRGIVQRVGRFSSRRPLFRDAIAAFGKPTKVEKTAATSCRVTWKRAGVLGFMENYSSGAQPCKPKSGITQALQLTKPRWVTQEGLRVGDTVAELQRRYPSAVRVGKRWWLSTYYTRAGGDGTTPSVTANMHNGRVVSLDVWIGAAGY